MSSFVDPKRAKKFECAICLQTLRKPVQVSQKCGHIYCKSCVHGLTISNERNFKCPLCRKECSLDTIMRAKFMDREINELMVYCPNAGTEKTEETEDDDIDVFDDDSKSNTNKNTKLRRSRRIKNKNANNSNKILGQKRNLSVNHNTKNKKRRLNQDICGWKGCYSELEAHLKKCPLELVECKHCGVEMPRKQLDAHYSKCEFVPTICPQCKQSNILKKDMKTHIDYVCPKTLINCADCDQSLQRMDMVNHLKMVCPEAIITCTFRRFGCNAQFKRKDHAKHIEEAAASELHLTQVASFQMGRADTMADTMSAIKKNNEMIVKEIRSIQKDVQGMKKDINDMKQQQICQSARIIGNNRRLRDLENACSRTNGALNRLSKAMPKNYSDCRIAYVGVDSVNYNFQEVYHVTDDGRRKYHGDLE